MVRRRKRKRKSKYRNEPVEYYGIRFASKLEGARYLYLLSLEREGVITDLETQPVYVLQRGFTAFDGKRHRAIKYIGDFRYKDREGNLILEDVKGGKATMTPVFRIKEKLFRKKYPDIDFRIVMPGDWGYRCDGQSMG